VLDPDAAVARMSGDHIARSDEGAATTRPAILSRTLFATWWSLRGRDVGSRGQPEAHLGRGLLPSSTMGLCSAGVRCQQAAHDRWLAYAVAARRWLSPVPALTFYCGGGPPSPQRLADVVRGSPAPCEGIHVSEL